MPKRQIHNMDIIPHPGSVRRIIIIAEYTQFFQLTYRHLRNIRHQVIRYSVGILTYGTALMRPNGIKVAQQDYIPLRIRFLNVHQNLFQHRFGPAIRVRTLSFRALLRNRNDCGISVYCRRWWENNVLHAVFTHHIHQSQCTRNVVFIVFPRLCHRLTHCFQPGKVNAAVNLLFLKDFIHGSPVQNVRFIERNFLPGDSLHPL